MLSRHGVCEYKHYKTSNPTMQGSLHISYFNLHLAVQGGNFKSTKKDSKLFTDHSIEYKLANQRTHGRKCAPVGRAWSWPAQNTKTNRQK